MSNKKNILEFGKNVICTTKANLSKGAKILVKIKVRTCSLYLPKVQGLLWKWAKVSKQITVHQHQSILIIDDYH